MLFGRSRSNNVVTEIACDASGNLYTTPSSSGSLPASAAALTNINDSAANQTLVAANTSRRGLLAFNDSTVGLYLKYGATATITSFTVLIPAGGYWEMPSPIYQGIVDGIWASDAAGAVRLTELT